MKVKSIYLVFLILAMYKADNTKICKFCKIMNNFNIKFLKGLKTVSPIASVLCSYLIFPYYNVCNFYVSTFFGHFVKNETSFLKKSNYFCGNYLKLCESKIVFRSFEDYSKELFLDYDEEKINKNYENKINNEEYDILVFADMHFDPLYKEGTYEVCGKPAGCCRENSEPYGNITQKAKYWGSYEKCNNPFRLFDQVLRFIKNDLEKKPKFIFLLGDDNPHASFYLNKSNYSNNSKLISKKLLENFDKDSTYFIPVIGNHDTEFQDQFNFESKENIGFSEAYKDLYSDENFLKYGFYARRIEKYNLKILSLNSMVFDKFNTYLLKNPTDPMGMLKWLIKELKMSEDLGEDVIIASHFPLYSGDFQKQYLKYIEPVFERFKRTIKTHLASHFHKDLTQCIRKFSNKNQCINYTFLNPSLASYNNINPSFRIYNINKNNNISNYYQYRLNLEKWNKFPKSNLKWDLAYDFLSEYDLKDMSLDSLNDFFNKINTNSKYRDRYRYHLFTGRVDSNISRKNDNNPNDFDEDQFLAYIDAIMPDWFDFKEENNN